MPTFDVSVPAALLAAMVSAGGCSSSPPAGGCRPYVSTANLQAPKVSFANDVMPIFQGSCALADACHGDASAVADHRPLLGYADADAGMGSYQAIVDGLVGVKSSEDLSMNLVSAGDPANSFLMHKMDDDQCTLIPQCMMGNSYRPNCGVFMPYQGPDILDVFTRDTVRRWIEQGAPSN